MNPLHPDLKRLMAWSRNAAPARSDEVPFGFHSRVLPQWKPGEIDQATLDLRKITRAACCLSGVIILGGIMLLALQAHTPWVLRELSTETQFIAKNLTP